MIRSWLIHGVQFRTGCPGGRNATGWECEQSDSGAGSCEFTGFCKRNGWTRTASCARQLFHANGFLSLAASYRRVSSAATLPEQDSGRLNYAGPDRTFQSLSFTELTSGRVPESALTGPYRPYWRDRA